MKFNYKFNLILLFINLFLIPFVSNKTLPLVLLMVLFTGVNAFLCKWVDDKLRQIENIKESKKLKVKDLYPEEK